MINRHWTARPSLLYSTPLPLWISGLNNKIDREISKDLKWNWSRQHFSLSTLFNILVHGTCCWYLTFQSASYDGSWLTSPPVACVVVELWLWPTRDYIWHLLSHIQHRLGGVVRTHWVTGDLEHNIRMSWWSQTTTERICLGLVI